MLMMMMMNAFTVGKFSLDMKVVGYSVLFVRSLKTKMMAFFAKSDLL